MCLVLFNSSLAFLVNLTNFLVTRHTQQIFYYPSGKCPELAWIYCMLSRPNLLTDNFKLMNIWLRKEKLDIFLIHLFPALGMYVLQFSRFWGMPTGRYCGSLNFDVQKPNLCYWYGRLCTVHQRRSTDENLYRVCIAFSHWKLRSGASIIIIYPNKKNLGLITFRTYEVREV